MNQVTNILLIVLAVIGAIALIGVLSMWLMHGMMMGPSMLVGGFLAVPRYYRRQGGSMLRPCVWWLSA